MNDLAEAATDGSMISSLIIISREHLRERKPSSVLREGINRVLKRQLLQKRLHIRCLTFQSISRTENEQNSSLLQKSAPNGDNLHFQILPSSSVQYLPTLRPFPDVSEFHGVLGLCKQCGREMVVGIGGYQPLA